MYVDEMVLFLLCHLSILHNLHDVLLASCNHFMSYGLVLPFAVSSCSGSPFGWILDEQPASAVSFARASQWSRVCCATIVFAFSSRRPCEHQSRSNRCSKFLGRSSSEVLHILSCDSVAAVAAVAAELQVSTALQGMSCYRERRKGCRKRKSVRGVAPTFWSAEISKI